jgi:membrane protein required for colicin V production
MNLMDVIIISTMVFFIVKGLFRGFIREIASLAGVLFGILLANHFQPQMTTYLRTLLPSTNYLPFISFASIFAIALIACNLLGYALKLLFSKAFLAWVDRTLGFGFALIKGVILIYLAIVVLTFYMPAKTPLIAESKLAPWIIVSYQSMIKVISPSHYENWRKKLVGEEKESGKQGAAPNQGQE